MKIEYLLQTKTEPAGSNINAKIRLRNALKGCYYRVADNSFGLSEDDEEEKISYDFVEHIVQMDGKTTLLIYLTFFIEGNPTLKSSSLIDKADSVLIKEINKGDSKFHITRLYDERSIFYCVKAYPMFCRFESKLRCLILKLLTKTLGYLWAQKTISKEIRDELAQKLRSNNLEKIASEAIYEMDYSALRDFLFKPYRAIKSDEVVDKILSDEEFKTKKNFEILALLQQAKFASNWERFFADVHISQLEMKLKNISDQRNKIAHSKYYSCNDYNEDKSRIRGFIRQIDEAISEIEIKKISLQEGAATLNSFIIFSDIISEMMTSQYRQFFDALGEISNKIVTNFITASKDMYNVVDFSKKIIENLNIPVVEVGGTVQKSLGLISPLTEAKENELESQNSDVTDQNPITIKRSRIKEDESQEIPDSTKNKETDEI